MGNNLSPILAIIYLNSLEFTLSVDLKSDIVFWKRYIDDIFVITKIPLDTITNRANEINEHIKFTFENPDNLGNIPFLDTMVSVNTTG